MAMIFAPKYSRAAAMPSRMIRLPYPLPDGNLVHVRPGGTDPAQGYELVVFREPQVDGSLVVPVHVLIDTVLLHDENLAADPQELVKLVNRQFGKRFLMEYDSHYFKDKDYFFFFVPLSPLCS